MSDRLAVANEILATFVPITLHRKGSRLRMSWGRWDFPADLRGDGSLPRYGERQRPCGHTGLSALSQLIRYSRDCTRLPLLAWEYWASDTIKLCNAETLRLIRDCDYGNPDKTCCVLCGTTDFRGLDWWSLDGVTGPSCRYGQCALPPTHQPQKEGVRE